MQSTLYQFANWKKNPENFDFCDQGDFSFLNLPSKLDNELIFLIEPLHKRKKFSGKDQTSSFKHWLSVHYKPFGLSGTSLRSWFQKSVHTRPFGAYWGTSLRSWFKKVTPTYDDFDFF